MGRLVRWLALLGRQLCWVAWESQAVIGGSAGRNPYGVPGPAHSPWIGLRDDAYPRYRTLYKSEAN